MIVHPSPPTDVPSLVEAYREVLGTFIGTCDGLRAAEWELPTACPGWTPREHLAHVVHIEDYLAGSEHPVSGWSGDDASLEVSVGSPEHVRNHFGVWIEEGIRARADRAPGELVAELRGLVDLRVAQMYDPDLALDTPVRSAMGEEQDFGTLVRLRISDVWAHGQDIRAAVGRPGALDSPGASIFTAHVLSAVPRVVARRVAPEPGTVVIVESTGPVTGRAGVRIGTDAQGEPVAHELFTGQAEEAEAAASGEGSADAAASADTAAPAADAVTTIALSTHELTRRAAGRQTTEDTAYHVIGDEDLARRVLDALTLTP